MIAIPALTLWQPWASLVALGLCAGVVAAAAAVVMGVTEKAR